MMLARRPRALLAALALVAVALCAAPPASPAAPAKTSAKKTAIAKRPNAKKPAKKLTGYHPHNGPAPADEYFGRLGMSVLGVRSKVKDLGLDADLHPEHDQAILNNALWVEDAMRDWAKKYPFDRWLPRYASALEQMYEEIPGDAAHKRAVKQVDYITAYFPQTLYARIGRAQARAGSADSRSVRSADRAQRTRAPRLDRRQGHPDHAARPESGGRVDPGPQPVAGCERCAGVGRSRPLT